MLTKQLHLSRHLGDDPCATLLRANLKELVIQALVDNFSLESRYRGQVCLRLFGSTLIRASSSSFPFADRKSEDLDLEVYVSPLATHININELFRTSLHQIVRILSKSAIKVETYDSRTVEEAINYVSNGLSLETLRLKLTYTFPQNLLSLLCGRYAGNANSNIGVLEANISPPHQITVLIPPTCTLDDHTESINSCFQYDTVIHYLSKVITRSIQVSPGFVPNLKDPSTFRPTDIMNVFNICYAVNPKLLPFRISLYADPSRGRIIERSKELLTLRLLVICNFAVFGRSGDDVGSIDITKFDQSNESNIRDFAAALAPSLGRGDVLEPRKLRIVLGGFKRLLEELFPDFESPHKGLFLFPEEKRFLTIARGSIADGLSIDLSSMRGLFNGRYGAIIDQLSPHIIEALKKSPAILERESRFYEMSQLTVEG